MPDDVLFRIEFSAPLIEWRGPSPFHFIPIPAAEADEIRTLAPLVTYGWGVIPVRACIGDTEFTTSLFPRDGGYLLPVKDAVRRGERLAVGDLVRVEMTLGR